MTEKLKLQQAVVVEGRYDKHKLSEWLDALIVETNGFGVFKDRERLAFIRKLARERGIILLTDSDHAGFMIRQYIASGIPQEQITHVYIPDIIGKEKRKIAPSKEGKLGVEGMSLAVLQQAFERAGVTAEVRVNENPITAYDLYAAGLSGTPNAAEKKKRLLREWNLPAYLSKTALLSCLNHMMTKEEFYQQTKKEEPDA